MTTMGARGRFAWLLVLACMMHCSGIVDAASTIERGFRVVNVTESGVANLLPAFGWLGSGETDFVA